MDATFAAASVGEGRAAAASGRGAAARPLVLVTNDDGYSAMGIKAIVAQLEEFAGQGGTQQRFAVRAALCCRSRDDAIGSQFCSG